MIVIKELDDARMMDAGSDSELVIQGFHGPGVREPTSHEELDRHPTLVSDMAGSPYISDRPLAHTLLQLQGSQAQTF
jgi:hypothetical protein